MFFIPQQSKNQKQDAIIVSEGSLGYFWSILFFLFEQVYILLMGNQPQGTRRLSKPTRYSKNSYSFDEGSIMSRRIDPPPSQRQKSQPVQNILTSQIIPHKQPVDASPSFSLPNKQDTMQRSMTNPQILQVNKKVKASNDQRLSQLNLKNDKLRKELIRISSELTAKLGKKKFEQRKKQKQGEVEHDKSLPALRRELQNAYKQIDRYKKLVQQLKMNECTNNEDVLNEVQGKLIEVDFQINKTKNQIQAAKNIDKNQSIMIKKAENQLNNVQLKELKSQVQRLRNKLKSDHKIQRKKMHKQRIMQQYMFQLERKWRQMNGDYLPDIKSYANKHFQPELKSDKKKKQQIQYKPAKWQIKDAFQQLRSLKEKHEEYHMKIQKALKLKSTARQLNDRLKQDLQSAEKQLQTLHYKRDRYLQLVMGNIQFLMNEQEEEEIELSQQQQQQGFRAIIKGNDVPDQVMFDDHKIIQKVAYSELKIVAVNVWYTDKRQISAIQAIYYNGKQFFMGNKTANVTGEMEKETLELEEGDYIKNVMGSFNRKGAIEFLAFNSIKGKAKQFGKEIMNGLNFTFGVTRRQRPICISGYTFYDGNYWRINKLILDVTYL